MSSLSTKWRKYYRNQQFNVMGNHQPYAAELVPDKKLQRFLQADFFPNKPNQSTFSSGTCIASWRWWISVVTLQSMAFNTGQGNVWRRTNLPKVHRDELELGSGSKSGGTLIGKWPTNPIWKIIIRSEFFWDGLTFPLLYLVSADSGLLDLKPCAQYCSGDISSDGLSFT